MSAEWVAIEAMAIIADSLMEAYFLNSRLEPKYRPDASGALAFLCLAAWGSAATFLGFPQLLYDSVEYAIALLWLMLAKRGAFLQKLFGVALLFCFMLASSLIGAGAVSLIAGVAMQQTLEQNGSRALAIAIIKSSQMALLYALARKQTRARALQKGPNAALAFACAAVLACLVFMFASLPSFGEQAGYILAWLSAGLVFVLIAIFVMSEAYAAEQLRSVELASRLQRLELESQYYNELAALHSDLRAWKHEYKNNAVALRSLIQSGSASEALEWLDKTIGEPLAGEEGLLQTGCLPLDAVVSSKLSRARSLGIEASVQAVFPEECPIDDSDLCAIAGNLLDNAIEACERMEGGSKRFIRFSILLKGKSLAISVANSYSGEIRRAGDRLISSKGSPLHGIGLALVDGVVSKCNGNILREYKGGVFEAHALLPLAVAQKEGGQLA